MSGDERHMVELYGPPAAEPKLNTTSILVEFAKCLELEVKVIATLNGEEVE
jgi:hypothetical protein